ncbi:hypothetical protein DM860_015027 [Cuscuta australis]|uniref:Uncharacterized protein n=1 Tax=Cuscuta australis TaxID=267555 RepID=A0A328DF67_9ASTE|nr:hypothetical protein DM860_015027 [Cuscuta australis]
MEPNKLPVISKKFWSMLKAALFLLKQGISKKKLMLDLNLKLKRGKIAAARRAVIHHLTSSAATVSPASGVDFPDDPSDAFEFSCDNSPAHRRPPHSPNSNYLSIVVKKLAKHLRREAEAPPALEEEEEEAAEATASPALPGFGRTPVVRQLRVTDSPFQSGDGDEFYGDACHVDEAAELFIREFYENLRRQSSE